MLQHCITAVFILFLVTLSMEEEGPLIETSLGKVRGHYLQSYEGRNFAAFEGIPYAKPPINELRFEEPVEVEPWAGIWNASTVHTCVQAGRMIPEPIGSEDCLYLNVYVPEDKLNDNSNLDVVVHIHGGAFMFGDPNAARPEYLMDRNVVYLSMNYRVSVLGFLSTEDDEVLGNMGLKDQVMALRWVQKHIKSFGGNPDSVAITGVSAGAVCVHFHYFSQLSRGLFHRGVSHGGTALAPWAIHKAPLKEAKRLGASVGCDSSSTRELIKCLKQKPAAEITKNAYYSPIDGLPIAPFAPVVEKMHSGAFISDDPYKLLKAGNITDVPWIAGATTEEGLLVNVVLKFQYDDLNEHWNTLLPNVLNYQHTVAESDKIDVAQRIKRFYLNDNKVTEDNVQAAIKLFGDRYFHLDLEMSTRLQAKAAISPVYSYIYGYRDDANFQKLFGMPKFYGVCHGSDSRLVYSMKFLGITIPNGKLSKSDERVKNFLVDIVTSFAKNGKPISDDITWDPVVNAGEFRYLFIHNDEIKMTSKNELAPADFWQSLPLREYENSVSISAKDEL